MEVYKDLYSVKTAILVFSRSAKADAVYKGMPQNERVFEALTEHTLRVVGKTGLPHFLITEDLQSGNSFGERFANAFVAIFALGYDAIIAIGNDSPHLTAPQLLSAQDRLCQDMAALGPATDGGFYLMGLCRSHFDQHSFTQLPWQSRNLKSAFTTYLETRRIATKWFAYMNDIDSFADIRGFVDQKRNLSHSLRRLILSLFVPQDPPRNLFTTLIDQFQLKIP
ncbi:MAG: DUF2064 domain-containing protein, partial [Flavobacteriaceae bacterium]